MYVYIVGFPNLFVKILLSYNYHAFSFPDKIGIILESHALPLPTHFSLFGILFVFALKV